MKQYILSVLTVIASLEASESEASRPTTPVQQIVISHIDSPQRVSCTPQKAPNVRQDAVVPFTPTRRDIDFTQVVRVAEEEDDSDNSSLLFTTDDSSEEDTGYDSEEGSSPDYESLPGANELPAEPISREQLAQLQARLQRLDDLRRDRRD